MVPYLTVQYHAGTVSCCLFHNNLQQSIYRKSSYQKVCQGYTNQIQKLYMLNAFEISKLHECTLWYKYSLVQYSMVRQSTVLVLLYSQINAISRCLFHNNLQQSIYRKSSYQKVCQGYTNQIQKLYMLNAFEISKLHECTLWYKYSLVQYSMVRQSTVLVLLYSQINAILQSTEQSIYRKLSYQKVYGQIFKACTSGEILPNKD
eukprot:TRINITY_DN11354_c0_g2_i6.p3 TRINITY_DN11354_c0_g2~~TRINITY_DN11354_c0_g2_i6.p3  ORF type:complete len:204 (-),score=-6.35 TRINITY_DN11354_c0_g2_i6:972-1583(-)